MTDRHFAFWPRRVPHSLTLPETNVYYNLEVSATRYPEKTAMVYYGSEISYRRLAEEVNRFAGYLTQLGIGRGDRILFVYAEQSAVRDRLLRDPARQCRCCATQSDVCD